MWETGSIVTLRNASSTGQHELDLLVDASFANGKSKPLLLSLPSRPFARLRPPFSIKSRGNQQKRKRNPKQNQNQNQNNACSSISEQEVIHVPIAIDGKAVGKEALWLVHSAGGTTTAVSIESVAHPGIYLSVDECGRVTCLKKSSSNAMHCVFHATIADPINNVQKYTSTSSNSNTSSENMSSVSLPPVVRCKLPETQQHPHLSSSIINTNDNNSSSVICDGSVCSSTTATATAAATTKQPPWQRQTNNDADGSSSSSGGPLSKDQILQFAQDGYLVLRNVVPPRIWQPAAASVFGALGRPGAVVHGGDGSNSGHKAAGKLAGRYTQTPQMRALLGSDSTIARCAAQLMMITTTTGVGNDSNNNKRRANLADAIEISQTSAQVALRFPEPSLLGLCGVAVPEEDGLWAKVKPSCTIRGESTEKQHVVYDDDEKAVGSRQEQTKGDKAECERELQAKHLRELGVKWHIDGTRQRQYHGFTLLMGVALSDCGVVHMVDNSGGGDGGGGKTNGVSLTSELEGQLCVWPLSHWDLQGMGRMCEPKPVDYASLVKAGAPLNDYEYFDYLDSADAISRERSMKYLDAAAADSILSEEGNTFTTSLSNSHDDCAAKNTTNATPICSSSPGGFGPVIVALKAGDGVLLHCETAHAATPNFNPSKVRAMAYYRLRLLPSCSTTTTDEYKRKFHGDADRKEMRDLYEWGMEYDRTLNFNDDNNAIKEDSNSDNMLTPDAAIAAAKQMLASLWPDLGGVSEVLSEYLDGMTNHQQQQQQQQQVDTIKKIEVEGVEGFNNEEINKKLGLKLLRMCNLHPRSPMCNV